MAVGNWRFGGLLMALFLVLWAGLLGTLVLCLYFAMDASEAKEKGVALESQAREEEDRSLLEKQRADEAQKQLESSRRENETTREDAKKFQELAKGRERELDRAQTTAEEAEKAAQRSREVAEAEKLAAKTARKELAELREWARLKLHRAERVKYAGQVTEADRAMRRGHVVAAQDILDHTRWDFRDWEHRYVQTQCLMNARSLKPEQARVFSFTAYSPDDKLVAVVGSEGVLTIWEAVSGKMVNTIKDTHHNSTPFSFNADGTRILCLTGSNTIRWVELVSGKTVLEIKEDKLRFLPIAAARDDTRIVAGTGGASEKDPGGEVKVWDGKTGKELQHFKAHDQQITALAVSPDGKQIATASGDLTVKLWKLDTGEAVATLGTFQARITAVHFSPDGKHLAACSRDRSVRFWNAEGKETLTIRTPTQVHNFQFRPDGKEIATVGSGSSVYASSEVGFWDVQSGHLLQSFQVARDFLRGISYRSDGKELAIAEDRQVLLCPLPLALGPRRIQAHVGGVLHFAFSSDGKQLVSGGNDKNVKVWDTATGKELRVLPGHTLGVHDVEFSPDDKRIVSCAGGYTFEKGQRVPEVKVWDAQTGAKLFALRGHTEQVLTAQFSPDGTKILTCSRDKTIRIWETATGKELKTFADKGLYNYTRCIFNKEGTRIYVNGDGFLKCLHAETGEEMASVKREGLIMNLFLSPDGDTIYTASMDRTIRGYRSEQLGDFSEVYFLPSQNQFVSYGSLTPNGNRLVTTGQEGLVKVWDIKSGTEVLGFEDHGDRVSCARFSPDSSRLISSSWDGTLLIYDSNRTQPSMNLRGSFASIEHVRLSADGKRLVSAGHDYHLRIWDMTTGQEITSLRRPDALGGIALSPDGSRVTCTGGKDRKTLCVFDTRTGKELQQIQVDAPIRFVDIHPEGKSMALALGDGTVELRVVDSGELLAKTAMPPQTQAAVQVKFSPDGKRFAATFNVVSRPGASGSTVPLDVVIFDTNNGQPLTTCKGHTEPVNAICFSPDGQRLAAGGKERILRIWDSQSGKLLASSTRWTGGPFPTEIRALSFSPDGKWIAGSGDQGGVRLWDAASTKEALDIHELRAYGGICFTPDGKKLITAGLGFVVRIVDLEEEGLGK